MNEIAIASLLPGTKLDRDLYSIDGHLLLRKETILTETHLEHLSRMGYSHLYSSHSSPLGDDPYFEPASPLPRVFDQAVDNVRQLMSSIATGHMVHKEDIEETMDLVYSQVVKTGNVFTQLQQLRQQDEYTLQHSVSVGVISIKIGQTLGLPQHVLRSLGVAGLLHDIGKARIEPKILNKPGPLDDNEFREMKKHPLFGYQIVRDMKLDDPNIPAAVLQHHEHQNGKGYPQQLMGQQINLYSNIVAVADVFDALTSDRSYRKRMPLMTALNEITDQSKGHFDPLVSRGLFTYFMNLTPGAIVTLNTGEKATVILTNNKEPGRPLVRTDNSFIDLEHERSITIADLEL
jgi:putative nucleotidyltransferase with HDIG domain